MERALSNLSGRESNELIAMKERRAKKAKKAEENSFAAPPPFDMSFLDRNKNRVLA